MESFLTILKREFYKDVPIDFKTERVHYLLHRAAVKEDRETAKVRIVFDASQNIEMSYH